MWPLSLSKSQQILFHIFSLFFAVEDVQALIPDINILLTSLEDQRTNIQILQEKVEVDLRELRDKIAISRGEANQVRRIVPPCTNRFYGRYVSREYIEVGNVFYLNKINLYLIIKLNNTCYTIKDLFVEHHA